MTQATLPGAAAVRPRVLYLDLIKVAACFMVIVNHTNSRIFLSMAPSPTWCASVAYFFISKPAVPLFIMASGAVLLGRDEPVGKCLRRAARMALVLLICAVAYYAVANRESLTLAGLAGGLFKALSVPPSNALWYLYFYIGLLLMLPFLRAMVRGMQPVHYGYLAILSFGVLGAEPLLARFIPGFQLSMHYLWAQIPVVVSYFIIGHYLHSRLRLTRRLIIAAVAGCVVTPPVSVWLTYGAYRPEGGYMFLDSVSNLVVIIPSLGLFILLKALAERFPPGARLGRFITATAGCTFGVYLISDMAIVATADFHRWFSGYVPPLLSMLCWELWLFAGCCLLIWLLRRLPPVRWLI